MLEVRKNKKQDIENLSKQINSKIRSHREKPRSEIINYYIENTSGIKKAQLELRKYSNWILNIETSQKFENKTNRIITRGRAWPSSVKQNWRAAPRVILHEPFEATFYPFITQKLFHLNLSNLAKKFRPATCIRASNFINTAQMVI